jgi:hypothetical protein
MCHCWRRIKVYGSKISTKRQEPPNDKRIPHKHFGPKDKKKRAATEIHKLGFSENDLWIAATAKRNNLTIVSADSDFKRMQEVLDISIESWYNPL